MKIAEDFCYYVGIAFMAVGSFIVVCVMLFIALFTDPKSKRPKKNKIQTEAV